MFSSIPSNQHCLGRRPQWRGSASLTEGRALIFRGWRALFCTAVRWNTDRRRSLLLVAAVDVHDSAQSMGSRSPWQPPGSQELLASVGATGKRKKEEKRKADSGQTNWLSAKQVLNPLSISTVDLVAATPSLSFHFRTSASLRTGTRLGGFFGKRCGSKWKWTWRQEQEDVCGSTVLWKGFL